MSHLINRWLQTIILAMCVLNVQVKSLDARQNDPRLNSLFERLHSLEHNQEAGVVMALIWQIWAESENPDLNTLFMSGIRAMNSKDYPDALLKFNTVIKRDPNFSEGWNARATLHYVMGNYDASIGDIRQTLQLEPRHWGALSGLGMIYQNTEQYQKAVEAYRLALSVNPHLPGARAAIEFLKEKIKGNAL